MADMMAEINNAEPTASNAIAMVLQVNFTREIRSSPGLAICGRCYDCGSVRSVHREPKHLARLHAQCLMGTQGREFRYQVFRDINQSTRLRVISNFDISI